MRRVVITGLGAVSPHGIGTQPFWNALLEAKSSITALTRFDPSAFESRVAAVAPPFKTTDFVPKSYPPESHQNHGTGYRTGGRCR